MKKVININFQGRVIPIEEPAYENLKKYVESLRAYFSNEEGKDEIVNDIENRIAELFNEKMKAGASFITEEHVEAVISSMGRPEQFDEISMNDESASSQHKQYQRSEHPRGNLFRNASDKLIGGVCSGIGSYFRVDTTIIRVLFVLLAFGSFGFMFFLYIILWAILPSKYITEAVVRRKLYRDADHKVIAGVLSGIAQYFDIQVWIPRLIFLIPVLLGVFKEAFPFGFPIFYGFSGSLTLTYIILWAVIPKAVTATEKMEMKGEKIDLESIKHKIQDELQGVKKHIDENKDQWASNIKTKSTAFAEEVKETAKPAGRGFFRFISAIFKVFVFFILGIIALTLFALGSAIVIAGVSLMPLKNFFPNTGMIQLYGWGSILLFFLLPIVALLVYFFRKLAGIKSTSSWLGWTWGALWTLGWISITLFFVTISKEFKRTGQVKQTVQLQQPSTGNLQLMFTDPEGKFYPMDWFDLSNETDEEMAVINGLRLSRKEDSILMNNMRIRLQKSKDDSFHVSIVKRARASNAADAEMYAEQINFKVEQTDSILNIPYGFIIDNKSKFRNQQLIVVVEVPVGKEVYVDRRANSLNWFNIRGGNGLTFNMEDDYDNESWRPGVWYKMTASGIERMGDLSDPDAPGQPPLPDSPIDPEEKIERLREEIREKEKELKSAAIKFNKKDTTIEMVSGANGLNNKISSVASAPEQTASKGNFQILFRALNLLKLAR
jgi:phage shock protein PspC (stress-responsive transcriptional regulator)